MNFHYVFGTLLGLGMPWANTSSDESYKLLDYHEIVNIFHNLTNYHSDLIKVESVHEKYGLPYQYGEGGNSKCTIYLVTISDFKSKNNYKPQIYLSGNLHGDEQLGPNVMTYLASYLLENYEKDDDVKWLLQNRQILITPTTNSQGYFHNRRTELAEGNINIDINRDFPYNRLNDNGFMSIAARAVFKIFQMNEIVGSLTYHGGTEVIGFPWGSYNHRIGMFSKTSTEAPDHNMFNKISNVLKKAAHVDRWSDLQTGDMTSTVYSGYGAMEDWAYGAAWDKSKDAEVKEGKPSSNLPFNNTEYFTDFEHIRPAIYLIEASSRKTPLENKLGDKKDIFCNKCSSDGHINRHMRLILSFVELMQTQLNVTNINLVENGAKIEVKWTIYGGITLNQMDILVHNASTNSFVAFPKIASNPIDGNKNGIRANFTHKIPISDSQNSESKFTFKLLSDQDFLDQKDPDPNVPPQTHLVRLKSPQRVDIEDKLTNRQMIYILKIKNGNVSLFEEDSESGINDGF